jgi:deoxyhypusine synthase
MRGPEKALDAVLVHSEPIPEDTPTVQGYDFNQGVDFQKILDSYLTTGYQATQLGEAIEIIRSMVLGIHVDSLE